ncbi:HYC_CC_PP family protein [Cellulophaga lytica]|uniref:Secreted protein n=1 Tax=Cellulophaga lytica (strain ATCC 23178 / DSM 7489 / JCM 8516 / NBRC 14961 / NCIMB 1423 / VKM B-1433 / Cy l20) TaxID=867900 RepID=F0RCC8_CELLC|nr:hypothetical protein [Cellulophaga lytica]ADY28605.1 hypothetical protein Celly_0773 [Cellulophaga lytica DSM 7489]WQG77218.1 hypothetical protein SR888_16170 [Cellulophaga lytica]
MKQLLHKITTIALALLVLLSTVSFAVEKHFCCGELVSVSVYPEDFGCGESAFVQTSNTSEDNCCKGILEAVKGQDRLTVASDQKEKVITQYVVTSILSLTASDLYVLKQKTSEKKYAPPLLVQNLQVSHQVFII